MANSELSPESNSAPPADAVKAETERILASPVFEKSKRISGFLKFIVDETLAGRAHELKEFTIAEKVYGRDESFDSRVDPIVRVEAGRLRAKLREHADTFGRGAAIRIELPKGGYVPEFHTAAREQLEPRQRDAESSALPSRRAFPKLVIVALAGILVILGGAGVYLYGAGQTGDDVRQTADNLVNKGLPRARYAVAVLPLRNLSQAKDQDYFSDGMTEALINRIAKNRMIRVTSMTSVQRYKNVNKPIAEIAKELNVGHVIEGTVLRAKDRVRITAQLIEAKTNRHLWADSYEREIKHVLAVQQDVARRIIGALAGKHGMPASTQSATPREIDPVANEAYLKGRFFRNKMTKEGLARGIQYFQEAIKNLPTYAPAYAGMASCYCLLSGHGFEITKPSEAMPMAKAAVLTALKLDDGLAESHAFHGIILLKYEWNFAAAEQAIEKAILLNPSYSQARLVYSFFLEAMGRQDEAIYQAELARAIDPLSLPINVNLGWQYLQAGKIEPAGRQFQRTAELDRNFWGVHWGMGQYYLRKGMHAEAIAAFKRSINAMGGHTLPMSALGYAYALAGMRGEAQRVIDDLNVLAKKSYVSAFNIARIHIGLEDKDKAFSSLERAFEERSRSLAWLKVSPEFRGLHVDPRFNSLARRIGLPD